MTDAAILPPLLDVLLSIPRTAPIARGNMHFIPAMVRLRVPVPLGAGGGGGGSSKHCDTFTLRLDRAWTSAGVLQAKLVFSEGGPVPLPPAPSPVPAPALDAVAAWHRRRRARHRARTAWLSAAGWTAASHCAARVAEFTREYRLHDCAQGCGCAECAGLLRAAGDRGGGGSGNVEHDGGDVVCRCDRGAPFISIQGNSGDEARHAALENVALDLLVAFTEACGLRRQHRVDLLPFRYWTSPSVANVS